jgi:glycosyltransferase involved in cell wall biosynthesis
MKENLLVSVAMCTYNGSRFLANQLDTIVNQTYKNIEIIVVDDCSTDETLTILNNYARLYPQLHVYQNESNLGFTANFERAVSLCKGELIALCDQDDLWHPEKIELQVKSIGDNVFIYHDSEFIHEDGESMNKKMSDIVHLYRGGDPLAFLFFNCVSGHTILMKRDLLNFAIPLKKEYFHDWWLSYVATNIGKIDFIPQCLVKYRQHEKSETNILRVSREKDNYRLSSFEKSNKALNWFLQCKLFRNNKNQAIIERFYSAYKKAIESFISYKICWLMFSYWDTIFYTRKKTVFSNLNFIRKQMFGLN